MICLCVQLKLLQRTHLVPLCPVRLVEMVRTCRHKTRVQGDQKSQLLRTRNNKTLDGSNWRCHKSLLLYQL